MPTRFPVSGWAQSRAQAAPVLLDRQFPDRKRARGRQGKPKEFQEDYQLVVILGEGYLNLLKQLFLCLALGGVVAAETELDSLRWKRRVLVIASPSRNTPAYLSQRQELNVEGPDWKERDLFLLEVIGAEKADLRGAWNLRTGDFTVLLLGKDGGVKLRSGTPVSAREIYQLIDSMPMRQQEIRSKI